MFHDIDPDPETIAALHDCETKINDERTNIKWLAGKLHHATNWPEAKHALEDLQLAAVALKSYEQEYARLRGE